MVTARDAGRQHGGERAERERAESRLRVAERHLRLALEGSDAYFWDWDLEARRLDVDSRWARIFGHDSGGFEAAPLAVPALFTCEEDMPQVSELLAACVSGARDTLASKHRVRTPAGSLLWVRIRAKVVDRCPDGTPTRIAGTIADITERKKLRERLEQAERLASIGALAGSMAHEINNPLACVLANVEYALSAMEAAPAQVRAAWAAWQPGGLEELAQALREADHSACRVRDIVRGLRRFVGERTPGGACAPLRGAVALALDAARDELARCAEIVSEIPDALFVEVGEAHLVQVFTALLVNAAEATSAAPNRVRIAARALPAEGVVAIEVSDTGAGIAPEALPHVFEPFFTTKGISGRGLGLSVSRGIVKSAGGDIEAESSAGAGSTVRIVLPIAK
jgi:two-component system NtrC family sensor kinase